jgi:hypothetical protein
MYSENVSSSSISYLTNPEKRRRLKKIILVTAAHHPHCDYYQNHYFTIRNVKVCRGCTVYYPTSIIAMILVWFLPAGIFKKQPFDLTLIGLLFLVPAFIHLSKIDRIVRIDRIISILSRISLGLGMGWLIRYFFVVPFQYKITAIVILIMSILLIQIARFRNYWEECEFCPYKPYRGLYNHCPGLLELNQILNPSIVQYFENFPTELELNNPKLRTQ